MQQPVRQTSNETEFSTAYYFLEGLNELGIEYLFCNFGTDHAPIIEEMAHKQNLGEKVPTVIRCPHENTAAHMAVHPTAIGPVAFDGHGIEMPFGDQATAYGRPHPVELVRTVSGLPEHDNPALARTLDEIVVIVVIAFQHLGTGTDARDLRVFVHRMPPSA